MTLQLAIIGPSGCGKSTQARLIAQKYSLTHYSMGALLREHMATHPDSPVKPYVDSGTWAPDSITIPILLEKLKDIQYQNFIVDGFPRVLSQGRMFEEELYKTGHTLNHIIHLTIPFTTIFSRRLKAELETGTRFSDANRTDETPEAIASRQKSYDESIEPILNYYSEKQLITQIDATPDIQTIFANITNIIDSMQKSTN